jgi:hypothetical protein
MKERVDLDEFMELLNIPEFEKLIYHKIEELKCLLRNEIKIYRTIKDNFKKTACSNTYIFENDAPQKVHTYRFELSRVESRKWIPVKIEPLPPRGCSVDDIIPTSLIQHIVSYPVNPEKIRSYRLETAGTGKRQYHVAEFVKYSDDYLFGAVRQVEISEQKTSTQNQEPRIVKIDWDYEKKGDEQNYQDLFYYMQRYPEIKKCILGDFFHRLKPLLDSRLKRVSWS